MTAAQSASRAAEGSDEGVRMVRSLYGARRHLHLTVG